MIVKLLVFEITFLDKDKNSDVLEVFLESANPLIHWRALALEFSITRASTTLLEIWNMNAIHMIMISKWNQIKASIQQNVFGCKDVF